MTDKQINTAIAEACGIISEDKWVLLYKTASGWVRDCPDYCNDLNAMHEVEESLSDFEYDLFLGSLIELCIVVGRERINSATASQRAEAFLRILGKWEEARK